MRSEQEYQAALRLIDEGINDSAIGRELGIPRGTIRDWREGVEAESGGRTKFWFGSRKSTCFVCDEGWFRFEEGLRGRADVLEALALRFPQHGPGRKHERRIELLPWQQAMVDTYPEALIRGLIQSDGNRHINVVTRKLAAGRKKYGYSRYMFTNASTDILGIFTSTLDALDVHWTRTTQRDVAISRRADVEYLDTFVGPKS